MLVAVEETAAATGKKNQGEATVDGATATHGAVGVSLRSVAAAIGLGVVGMTTASAQVVADPNGGAHRPTVIQTANGIQQVNVSCPSAAGVSINGYTQFDVPKAGVILNNSPTIVNAQQAGYINGNPNFAANESAKVIVNQVNSRAASQINGYVEVAGNRAEVVIANGSGISVNGGGFINTSRAILTTGTPNFGPDGSRTGFNVTGGNISIQGAGLNASNVDQVDLISRAVQANAAIYAKNLNVVTGANHVDHDTLNATPIAGDGPAPGVSIDVSNLGGMYANRIMLVGTENGVGVSNKGVLAAQAGDLILTTQGKLVLAGQTNASGNISAIAHDGIDNSGTTYAQQNISASTVGALTNSGTLAAQQNATVSASSIASSGTLGAGVNGDGTIAKSGDLILAASASDINLSGTTTTAGGALNANAAGTFSVSQGKLSSGDAMHVSASNVANTGGQIVSQSTLDLSASHALDNRQGTIQSAAHASVSADSLDNTAGRIVSLNSDGMSLTTTGALVNAPGTTASAATGGVIGTNGALTISAGTLSNQGQLSAASDAQVRTQSVDNHGGNISAGGALDAKATGELNNTGGTLSSASTSVSAASIDNTSGSIDGDALSVSASGNLTNRGGKLTQYGTTDQTISAGGTFDNSNGTTASNANKLNIAAGSIVNDSGSIQHAGTNTLGITTTGDVSNVAGGLVTNGALDVQAGGALNNTRGTVQAAGGAKIDAASLDNSSGRIVSLSGDGMTLKTTGALVNAAGTSASGDAGGVIGTNGALSVTAGTFSNHGQLSSASDATVHAESVDNQAGSVTAGGALDATSTGALNNTGGTLSGSATSVAAASIDNTSGSIDGDALSVSATGDLTNRGGKLTQYGTTDQTIRAGGTLDNTNGTVASNANNLNVFANRIVNDSGTIQHAGSGALVANATGAMTNVSGRSLPTAR
ncbi:Filamentous haemagglutinin family outer membrane protein (fragment) [Paraburkholderia piptadeniae]|uniref:Filamentous haemagglutinin family outer membrane protein n=1 Tax=Paraburkholderia piptadeniae TaxID=1701573 RepID=A0A1N7S2K4_9BURK